MDHKFKAIWPQTANETMITLDVSLGGEKSGRAA